MKTIKQDEYINLALALDIGLQILDLEEFELHLYIDEAVNKKSFFLKDMQSTNLGGIERETFFKLSAIIDRLDIYHANYLYFAYEERRCTEPKEEILEGDWDSAILYLLSNKGSF